MMITTKQEEINKVIDYLTENVYQIDNIIDEDDDYQLFFGQLYDFFVHKNIEKNYKNIVTEYISRTTISMDIVNVNGLIYKLDELMLTCNCMLKKEVILIQDITKLKKELKTAKPKVLTLK